MPRRSRTFLLATAGIVLVLLIVAVVTFKGRKILAFFQPPPKVEVSSLDLESFDSVKVYRSNQQTKGLVILAADTAHAQIRDEDAMAMAQAGIVAVTFDLEALRHRQATQPRNEECHYISDDLKDAGETVQRHLGIKKYLFPLIVGYGDGAPFAYAAIAQAPENTLGGAISIGFVPKLKTDRPYCPNALDHDIAIAEVPEREYVLQNSLQLPSPWRVITSSSEREAIVAFQRPLDDTELIVADGVKQQRKALLDAIIEMGRQGDEGIQNLPVSLIEPEGQAQAVIIIISGDGGWRDIDKSVGEKLAAKGIAVVGIDSLRYFWSKREPAQIAADLDLLLSHYGEKFKSKRYAIAGYSFGADVIPFAWPLMAKATRDNTVLISLWGLEPDVEFEISVEGYLGSTTDESKPVKPMLPRLPLARTQCIYGTEEVEEEDTACIYPELDGVERVAMKGGHHFDEDYDGLAEKIAARLLTNSPAPAQTNGNDK